MRIDRRVVAMCGAACFVLGPQSGIVSAASGSLAPSAVLYDQISNLNGSIISQNFLNGADNYDNQAADDFQVPSGFTWTITKITTPGDYYMSLPPQSLNVTFYQNSGNVPGPIVCNYPAVTVFTGQGTGTFVITLPGAGCALQQGTYWVSVQATMSTGDWSWKARNGQSLNTSVWRNPGGGYGFCQNWGPVNQCFASAPDLAFKLEGTSAATGCTSDAQCQNGNACDGTETCVAGSCQPGTPVPPGEVAGFGFCGINPHCLRWTSDACAPIHRVYVGSGTTLPGVLDSRADSCLVGVFQGASTGPLALPTPLPGTLQWFLATGYNEAGGEGTAGDTSASPRHLDTYPGCQSPLVINEVDYDQINNDSREFVEIYNAGALPQPLAGLALVFNNGAFMGGMEYLRVNLSAAGAMLLPGQYLVVAGNAVAVDPGALVLRFSNAENNVQNGPTDGLCLFDTASNMVIDALSYEGSITGATILGAPGTYNLVEGAPTSAEDSNTVEGSLSRLPNGQDTNDAQSDWFFSSRTPGAANTP